MPRVQIADTAQVEAVYRESHALWGIGLSPADYSRLWEEIQRTRWARRHARFLVWVDDRGRVLSSLKLYRPLIRIDGTVSRATVLGAIFTPRAHRGHGYASDLVRSVLGHARETGDRLALLFTDIGTTWYESLGFRALPAIEHWGPLPRIRTAAERSPLRPMVDADLDAMRQAHEDAHRQRRVAIVRDEEQWEFLRVRSDSYFSRVDDAGIRYRTLVASREGKFAGYITAVEGRGEWNVREVATPGGDPRDAAELLREGADEARRSGLRRYYAWLAPEVARALIDWKVRRGPRRRAVPMIAALDPEVDVEGLSADPAAHVPYQDQF